jgi:hypothetical protein
VGTCYGHGFLDQLESERPVKKKEKNNSVRNDNGNLNKHMHV